MTINETLAPVSARSGEESHEPFTAAWWERRTAEELRDIIKRGFAGGEAFQGAVSETERRAREETSRLREIAAVDDERRRQRKQWILRGSTAALIIASAAYWLAG